MNLERDVDRIIRKAALLGVAWVAFCAAVAAWAALRLTRPKELPC